jgi:FkbM family methyltransferase
MWVRWFGSTRKSIRPVREVNGWYLPDDCNYFDQFLKDKKYKQNGFQSEHLDEALKHVTKWDYAVDVGAHVGFWARDMADKFGKVYCFEPSPATFGCLAKNLAGYDNVELSCMAVGDKERKVAIRRDLRRGENSGSEFISVNNNGQTRMVSLDALELPGCDFLKIDVEGFELGVLKGAKKTIGKYKPVISMECDKKFAQRRYGWHDLEAQHFLLRKGYVEVAHMRPDKVFIAQSI